MFVKQYIGVVIILFCLFFSPRTNALTYDDKNSLDPLASSLSGGSGALVQIPKTGQTAFYASGDDGDLQVGVAWPDPRFADLGDGTVADNLTGLIWSQDADTPGPAACGPATTKLWQEALDYVTCLNSNAYLGYTDWILPNIIEMQSLIDVEHQSPSLPDDGYPFMGVQNSNYWSSSTFAEMTSYAWYVSVYNGVVSTNIKTDGLYLWPVRGRQTTFTVVLPETGQIDSFLPGDDGALQRGAAWPDSRFIDNNDGTVTDDLTGLVWLRIPNCFGSQPWDDALVSANNLSSGTCGLNDGSASGDWRLPNQKELTSLLDWGSVDLAIPAGHPFIGDQPISYWSSSTYSGSALLAWYLHISKGYVEYNGKTGSRGVWPVRGEIVPLTHSLVSLTIDGSTNVNEGSSATYTATARWADGTSSSVAPLWHENSSSTTISSNGVLTTSSVTADQSVIVTASYTQGGVTKFETINVTIVSLASVIISGTNNNDTLFGTSGNDTIDGGNGDDIIFTGLGNDLVDGGDGIDTLKMTHFPNVYQFTQTAANQYTVQYLGFTTVIDNVEYVEFGTHFQTKLPVAEMLSGNVQDQLAKLTDLYLAFFGRAADVSGLEYWQEQNLELDRDFVELSKDFAWSEEAQALYPVDGSNWDFVQTVYQNCFGRNPDPGGWNYWTDILNALGVTDLSDRGGFVGNLLLGAYAPTSGVEDRNLLTNRHEVALSYVNRLSAQPEKGFDPAINDLLALVNMDTSTLYKAENVIDHVFGNLETLSDVLNDPERLDAIWTYDPLPGVDIDGDGWTESQGDCNDNLTTTYPGAFETCNDGIDNNCDGVVDENCKFPVSLTIFGDQEIDENNTLQLEAWVTWSDNTTTDETENAHWSESSSAVESVVNGLVRSGQIIADETAMIIAEFNNNTVSDLHMITVKNDDNSTGIIDVSGPWSVTETIGANSCGQPTGASFDYPIDIVATGNSLNISTPAGTFSGTLNGSVASWSGSFPENGGTVTMTASGVAVSADGTSFSGRSSWNWTNGSSLRCSGTSTMMGKASTSNAAL